MLLVNSNVVKAVPANALSPIVTSDSGIFATDKAEQPPKASFPRESSEVSALKSTEASDVQFWKADSPMSEILPTKVSTPSAETDLAAQTISVRAEQPSKACDPIFRMLVKSTFVSDEQFLNM